MSVEPLRADGINGFNVYLTPSLTGKKGDNNMFTDSLTAEAKVLDSEITVIGGVCKFTNPETNEEVFFMIHPDLDGKPMVSRVKPSSIMPIKNPWEWMDSWLSHYEKNGKDGFLLSKFKEWLNTGSSVNKYMKEFVREVKDGKDPQF